MTQNPLGLFDVLVEEYKTQNPKVTGRWEAISSTPFVVKPARFPESRVSS
jgi:hypothetical protein